ncbi:hypothetical protein GCM10020331_033380 [Ectobacillus funiculus]
MIDIVIIILLLIGFFYRLETGAHSSGYTSSRLRFGIYCGIFVLQTFGGGATYCYSVSASGACRCARLVKKKHGYGKHVLQCDCLHPAVFLLQNLRFSLLGQLLNMIAQIPVLKQLNSLGGGVLGFVEVYIVLFIVILIGTLVPIQPLQSSLNASVLCQTIIDDTPVFVGQDEGIMGSRR